MTLLPFVPMCEPLMVSYCGFYFILQVTVDKWEPLLNNLGHVCRKLK